MLTNLHNPIIVMMHIIVMYIGLLIFACKCLLVKFVFVIFLFFIIYTILLVNKDLHIYIYIYTVSQKKVSHLIV